MFKIHNTPNNFPQIYQIELTEECNFSCPMCLNHMIDNKVTAGRELIDRIVDSGWLKNTIYTEFQFSGEPSLSPILEYAINKIHSVGTLVGMSTNLSTVKSKIRTFNNLDCLTISLDVFDKELYEDSRNPYSFEYFVDNLKFCLENISDDVLVHIQLLQTEWTKPRFYQAKGRLYTWMHDNGFDKKENVEIREISDSFISYHGNGECIPSVTPCLNPFLTVSIKSDGTVVPCSIDFLKEIPLGNVFDQDLLEMWQGDETSPINLLRNAHMSQTDLPEKCVKCYNRSPVGFMNNEIVPTVVRYKFSL